MNAAPGVRVERLVGRFVPMKIGTYQVPQDVIDSCILRMRSREQFRASDISFCAFQAKATPEHCDRIADRLIQLKRKAGKINGADKYPYWIWKD